MLVLRRESSLASIVRCETLEQENRELSSGEVLVRIEFASLNRIDILLQRGEIALPSSEHILGAEASGTIIRSASDVFGFEKGDRVAVYPYSGCESCTSCQAGNPTMCRAARITGVNASGLFREEVIVRASDVYLIQKNVPSDMAAVVSTVAVAWHVLVCRGRLRKGESVAISPVTSGLGAACGEVADQLGARVIGVGRSESLNSLRYRPEWLDETWSWNKLISEKFSRVDLVVEAAGSTIGYLHQRLKSSGRMVSVGGHQARSIEFDLWRLFTREQELIGSHGSHQDDMRRAVEMISLMDPKALVDSTFKPENHELAYERLDTQGKFGKVLFDFSSRTST